MTLLHEVYKQLRRFPRDQRGQDFCEYAMALALVASLASIILSYNGTISLGVIWARVASLLHNVSAS